MTTRIQTLGTLILFAALIYLALFVLFHNRRAAVNRRFALSATAIAGWLLCIPFALSSHDPVNTIVLGRFGFAFASAIPFTLLWMFDAFSPAEGRIRKPAVIVPGVLCGTFMLVSLSPWIVAGSTYATGIPGFIYGPAHKLFGIYFILCFAFALFTLGRTIRSASGLKKLQLRYLLLGILLGGTGAITTNLLIPLLWKTSKYSPLGPYFSLLVVSFSAHAIIRYRLMDIRVVIRKGAVYVLAIVASALVFITMVQLFKYLSGYERDSVPILEAVAVALVVAILFQPTKTFIHTSFNRYLYRSAYNYQRTIRDASRRLSAMLDLNSLLDYLTDVIEDTFRAEFVTVYLRGSSGTSFAARVPARAHGWSQLSSPPSVDQGSPLVSWLQAQRRALVREEGTRSPRDVSLAEATDALRGLGADIAFPLGEDRILLGIIVIGPKRSGDPYFAEDIDLLSTLISQAAVATKNAQLYREVVLGNEYVDNILSTMDSGVITVDAHGKVALVNATAERLTGLPKSFLTSLTADQLPESLAGPLRSTLSDGHPRPQVESTISMDGDRRFPIVCSTAALRDDRNSIVGALVVFSDLSQVKALESEKRRAERLAAFGALVSGIAHEIKNPLVAIRTFAELLPERFAEPDFREDFSKVVTTEIDRIDDLVGRLRGLAVPSLQQAKAIDIREPITETLSLLRGKFEQTQTTVLREFVDPSPLVGVDSGQLKQLFLNLFLNSVEAMGIGGTLTVRINRRVSHNGSWVTVDILDTGPGIPESIRSHIFDPFFTTKPHGSGLGLAICRGITDAHRGTIRAEGGHRKKGTAIIVEFPAADRKVELLEERTVSP